MTIFVLDKSVAMRWCFDAGTHPEADAVADALQEESAEALVPLLWRYEVASVLARAEGAGTLTSAKAAEFLRLLEALPIRADDASHHVIFTRVYRLATAHRLTAYDAAYLELALRRHLPLATFDQKLIGACRAAGVALFPEHRSADHR